MFFLIVKREGPGGYSLYLLIRIMEISKTLLKSTVRHLQTIIARAKIDPTDTTAVNAVRLARKEVRKIMIIIDREEQLK